MVEAALVVAGGRVVDPRHGRDEVADVGVSDGRVVAVGGEVRVAEGGRRLDAEGLLVLPGVIDLCARLREPGEAHKATMESETQAAVAGGITRLVCPPDTFPVIDTPAMARMVQDRAAGCGFARVHPLGALTVGLEGERLADMALLADAGCVGVSNGLQAVGNTLVMRRAMQYASTYDLPVFVTPRDFWLQGNGVVHEGEVSTRLGLPAIPEAAETVGVARDLALIETSGARAHFDLLSCARAVEMIAEAEARGLQITASVAVHHLYLNENNIGAFDTRYKVYPPLRTARDQEALVQGVRDGVLRAICSDHQPHEQDAKLAPFGEAAAGISGLDTLLPLTMMLVRDGVLPMETAVAALTVNAADIIGVDAGHLGVGAVADLCLFDAEAEWVLDEESMRSQGKNTPWLGGEMRGRVMATVVGGEVVFERG